jgi:hypothetical protein
MYGVFLLHKNGYEVENIEFILNEYIPNTDIYGELFRMGKEKFNLKKFTPQEIDYFESRCFPTSYGLSWDIVNIDLRISNEIIKKFFSPSTDVLSLYEKVIREKKINLNNTLFIWARKTDKIMETNIPEVIEYVKVINENNLNAKNIILQTDDYSVFKEFESTGLKFDYLDVIPFSIDGGGFHGRMDMKSDEEFHKNFNLTKLEYIKYMFVTSMVCKNSHTCIIYPGNPSTYIPMIKNTYENCYLFKNGNTCLTVSNN